MNNQLYVSIRHDGNLIKVPKAPYETEEKAYDRAWYIAKKLIIDCNNTVHPVQTVQTVQTHKSWDEISSLSHIWANEKYLYMKYK